MCKSCNHIHTFLILQGLCLCCKAATNVSQTSMQPWRGLAGKQLIFRCSKQCHLAIFADQPGSNKTIEQQAVQSMDSHECMLHAPICTLTCWGLTWIDSLEYVPAVMYVQVSRCCSPPDDNYPPCDLGIRTSSFNTTSQPTTTRRARAGGCGL